MPMLMLGARMLVFVRMSNIGLIMLMELIMLMSMFMNNRHVDVKMGVLFICQ